MSFSSSDQSANSQILPKMNVKGFYSGKNVFLSGVTGFLGKVILEKLFRSCPDINKIYIMVRKKRNNTPWDRIKKEILSSYCFSVVRKQHKDFMAFAESKIIPLEGDLIIDNLGLSFEDRQMIVENCNILINSAASVNFDDPLQDAIKINYMGCLRMLDLAKECKKLEVFTHVSTAYVNCNQKNGTIEENIYEEGIDSDSIIKRIMQMNPHQVAENERLLIGQFPNTYTFTKNMAEKTLLKRKGNLPVVLFRPSIIACSQEQPFPGWTDSLSAAGGITLMSGLGFINYINTKGLTRFDMVPVDIVVNGILVATAKQGTLKSKVLDIYNCGTSSSNSLMLEDYRVHCLNAFKYFSFNKKVFPVSVEFIPNKKVLNATKKIKVEVPIMITDFASRVPYFGSPQLRAQVAMLKKVHGKIDSMLDIYKFFIEGDWEYKNQRIYEALDMISPEERIEFNCDCKTINWPTYLAHYIKGLAIWALKEDQVEPVHNLQQMIMKDRFFGDDIKLTMKTRMNFKNKTTKIYEQSIMNKDRFNKFFLETASTGQHVVLNNQNWNKPSRLFEKSNIQKELTRLRCHLQKVPTQASFYFLSKMLNHTVDSLHVDIKSIEMMKEMTSNRKTRIVLMPIYRSYVDPLVMHYINYFTDQELGFTFGHYEDAHKINFIDLFLKRIGSLPIRRAPQNSLSSKSIKGSKIDKDISNYVNQSLFQEILEDNPITTLFQNDERIRSGKINLPLYPDQSVEILLKSYENLQKGKYDIKIVPVSINYDRLFDSSYLSNEIISGQFQNLNFGELLYYIYQTRPGKLGKIFVKYAEPINLSDYIKKFKTDTKESLSLKLTRDLYRTHQREQPVTMNSLISTSILFRPNSKATFGEIKSFSRQIFGYVRQKDLKHYISNAPSNYDINQAVLNLGFKVKGKPMDKKVGDQAIVDFHERDNLLKTLSMSYYANQLGIYFNVECIIAHSYNYYRKTQNDGEKIQISKVIEMAKFIEELFKNEFLSSSNDDLEKKNLELKLNKYVQEACKDGIMIKSGDLIQQNENDFLNNQKFQFLLNLMQPYVDSYFIVVTVINSLMEKGIVIDQQKLVNELHLGVQEIYYQGSIKFMSSCVYDYLNTAFGRCSELGICHSQTYKSREGNVIYISCPESNRQKLEKYLNILSQISSSDKRGFQVIEQQVEQMILQAQGPLARL